MAEVLAKTTFSSVIHNNEVCDEIVKCAATTANGGILTPATDIDYDPTVPEYQYDPSSYNTRVYQGLSLIHIQMCIRDSRVSGTGDADLP